MLHHLGELEEVKNKHHKSSFRLSLFVSLNKIQPIVYVHHLQEMEALIFKKWKLYLNSPNKKRKIVETFDNVESSKITVLF